MTSSFFVPSFREKVPGEPVWRMDFPPENRKEPYFESEDIPKKLLPFDIPLSNQSVAIRDSNLEEEMIFRWGVTLYSGDFDKEFFGLYFIRDRSIFLTVLKHSDISQNTIDILTLNDLTPGTSIGGYLVMRQISITVSREMKQFISNIEQFLHFCGWIYRGWFPTIYTVEQGRNRIPEILRYLFRDGGDGWTVELREIYEKKGDLHITICISTKGNYDFIRIRYQYMFTRVENGTHFLWNVYTKNKIVFFNYFEEVLQYTKKYIFSFHIEEMQKELNDIENSLIVLENTTEILPVLVLRAMVYENTLLITRNLIVEGSKR